MREYAIDLHLSNEDQIRGIVRSHVHPVNPSQQNDLQSVGAPEIPDRFFVVYVQLILNASRRARWCGGRIENAPR
jgi:hypothetical protein